jgi:hypothetical protein
MESFTCHEQLNRVNLATLAKQSKDPVEKAMLLKMLKRMDDDGNVEVTYKCINKDVGGRLYAVGGVSLQTINKRARAIISVAAWDFDIVNAHPVLLRNLCDRHEIPCDVLAGYVDNRAAWFAEGVKKLDVIITLFGGTEPSESDNIKALQTEMASITAKLSTLYPTLHNAVKKLKPRAGERKLDRTLVSYLLQREEMRVMDLVISKMGRKFPSLSIQAYIYDGFMVKKAEGVDPEHVLAQINSWVADLNVEFCIKPFECPSDFEPLPTEELETDKNDVAAFAAMLYMFPDYLKMKGSSRMVYNETTGRWDEEYIGTLYNIAKKVHSANDYGTSVRKMRDLFELMYTLPDDTAFFDSASEKAIGKLLFPNGIYDKRAGKRTGFTQEVYFRFAVPHAMPDSAPANVAKVDAFHFTDPFPEPGVASWLRQSMMKAVFGLGSDTVTFECGGGSNGKSTRFAGFRTAFGNHLVHTFDGKDLCVDKFKNPGGASPHLMPLAHVRLAYVSDPDPDMVLNMSLIKKTTGGDTLSCRGLNKGIEVFRSYAKFHFLVNRVPKFSECESSQLERRLHHLESDTIWTKKADQVDVSSRILLADAKLTEEVLASVDSLIWIMINEPLQDVPVPKSVELASHDTVADQDQLRKAFDEHFIAEPNGKVTSAELTAKLGVDARMLANRMTFWGFGKPKVIRISATKTVSGYPGVGLKRKRADESTENVGGGEAADVSESAGGPAGGPEASV